MLIGRLLIPPLDNPSNMMRDSVCVTHENSTVRETWSPVVAFDAESLSVWSATVIVEGIFAEERCVVNLKVSHEAYEVLCDIYGEAIKTVGRGSANLIEVTVHVVVKVKERNGVDYYVMILHDLHVLAHR